MILQTILALSLYFSLTFSGAACATLQSQSTNAGQASAAEDVPPDTLITMERTACFGTCPMYKLSIYGDGRVVFEGEEYVKQKGRIESSITLDKVQKLLKEFKQIKYFDLKSQYTDKDCPQIWTDNPAAITSLRLNGKTKTVNHYYGCQGLEILEKLTELEKKIDDTVDVDQWVK
jgi:hypothetical protein